MRIASRTSPHRVGRGDLRRRRLDRFADVDRSPGAATARCATTCDGYRIGIGLAGEAHDRPHSIELRERVDEIELRVAEPVRQVEHDLPDVAQVSRAVQRTAPAAASARSCSS